MKVDVEKYKKLSDKLVCVPSGFVREDGTEIMAWTLKSLIEGIQEENYNYLTKQYEEELEELYLQREQHISIVKEDGEEYIYVAQEYSKEENNKQSKEESNLQSNSKINNKHDKLFKILLSNKEEAVGFIKMVMNSKNDITSKNIELYNKEYITGKFEKRETVVLR